MFVGLHVVVVLAVDPTETLPSQAGPVQLGIDLRPPLSGIFYSNHP
jgi:hypothetical protein